MFFQPFISLLIVVEFPKSKLRALELLRDAVSFKNFVSLSIFATSTRHLNVLTSFLIPLLQFVYEPTLLIYLTTTAPSLLFMAKCYINISTVK